MSHLFYTSQKKSTFAVTYKQRIQILSVMAQKNTKKIETKSAQEQQVTIEDRLNNWEVFFEKNGKLVVACVIALIVIVAGIALYKVKVVEPREIMVSEYMFPGENYFIAENYELALNGDENGYIGFKEIAETYGGTKAGKLAGAYAGLCLAQLDQFEEAIPYLSKFNGKDQIVGPSVVGALANCYASTDQLDKAVESFLKAAKKADNDLLTPYYLSNAALIYEELGKNAEALKLYEQIKREYPASREGTAAESYITRLSAN